MLSTCQLIDVSRIKPISSFGPALALLAALISLATGARAAEVPRPASPGTERGATIPLATSRCPTFSWATVDGARGYELAIWRLASGAAGIDAGRTPELRQRLIGDVGSWTPDPGRCLQPGEAYGWAVAAIPEQGTPRWSKAALFRVTAPPTATELEAAISVVERYLEAAGVDTPDTAEGARRETATRADSPAPRRTDPDPQRRAQAPEPQGAFGLTPAMTVDGDLHVDSPDTPRLRLEQNDSLGFLTPQIWDLLGNANNIAIIDGTSGVVPFRIDAGAPDQALTVSAAGVISGDGSGLSGVDAADLSCSECVDTAQIADAAVNGPKLHANTVGTEEIAQIYAIMVECDGNCGNGLLNSLCSPGRAIAVACVDIPNGASTFSCGTGGTMTCSNVAVYGGAQLSRFCKDTAGWDAIVYCIPPGLD